MSRSNPRVATPARESIIASDQGSSTRRVRVLAKLLDNSIGIPGTGWKIGFDPIVGLIPGIGDLIGAVLSGYIILEAARKTGRRPFMLFTSTNKVYGRMDSRSLIAGPTRYRCIDQPDTNESQPLDFYSSFSSS